MVNHPRQWEHGGFLEIIDPRQRYQILAQERLKQLGVDEQGLTENYQRWIDDYIQGSAIQVLPKNELYWLLAS